jgi:hypothetical protein
METTAIIALVLLVISEVLPFTPYAGNGIVQQILRTLREIFPYSGRK